MSNVIEKFAIAFGFDGKEALKGIDQTEKGLTKVKKASKATSTAMVDDGKAAAKAFSAIRNEIVLLTGALVGATGFKSFISNSIDDITKLGFAAKNLGVTTEKLEAFQLANEKLGGSKGGITSLLANASKSLSELRTSGSGLLTDSSDMFSYLARGGSSAGLKNSEDVVYQFADILKKAFDESEGTGMNVAERLGITGDSINLMRLGSAEVRKMVEAQKAYTTISKEDAEKTQKLNVLIMNMQDNFKAVKEEILIGLIPALEGTTGIFTSLGNWFRDHKNDIGAKIGEWATKATEFIKALFGDDAKISSTLDNWANNFERLVTAIEKLAKAAGVINDTYDFFNPSEYKPDAKRIRKESTGSIIQEAIGLGVSSTPAMIKDGKKIVDFFVGKGWTREQAAGITANLWAESKFDPKSVQKGGGPGRGIAQWTHGDSREALFKQLYNKEIIDSSLEEQLNFVDWEMRHNEYKAGDALKGASSAKNAGSIVAGMYERPKDRIGAMFQRGQLARKLYAETYDNKGKSFAGGNGGTQITMNNTVIKADDVPKLTKQIDKVSRPLMSNNYSFAGQH